jgi:hypothetical protein
MGIPAVEELTRTLPGIRLAIFEILWPVQGLERVLIRAAAGHWEVYFESAEPLRDEDREACQRLVGEILDVALEKHGNIERRFSFGPAARSTQGAFEVAMSTKLFHEISAEVAPWRLSSSQ